jgi:hypothetical protein
VLRNSHICMYLNTLLQANTMYRHHKYHTTTASGAGTGKKHLAWASLMKWHYADPTLVGLPFAPLCE